MYKGVVFFDYDGTLIDERDQLFDLPQSAVDSLVKLRENGYATCICSGRTKQFAEDVKDYFDGYIAANGSYVEFQGERIASNEITIDEIEDLIDCIKGEEAFLLMDGESQSYSNGIGAPLFDNFMYVFHVKDHWVQPWDTEDKCPITKFSVMYKEDHVGEMVIEKFKDRFEIVRPNTLNFIDGTHHGVNKGAGVHMICKHLGLTKEQSYCFCDGANDLTLIQAVGTGVVLKRHHECLDEYAAFVTDTVKNDGVKKGLERLGLI